MNADALTGADWSVLRHLEDLEQSLINFGLYETSVSAAEVAARSQLFDAPPLAESAVADSLGRLARQMRVLDLPQGRFRSRTAEIVRLLKNVKQRFGPDDAGRAPYLVHSLRVHFQDRTRLLRRHDFVAAIEDLFARHHHLPWLDEARRAVRDGFAAEIGLPVDQVRLTGVQRRALAEVGFAYLQRLGGGFVITGNTGSGKTETALVPLLIGALQEKLNGVGGCKILLVYPRQALARNQLDRLARYLGAVNARLTGMGSDVGLSLGIVYNETPESDHELTHGSEYRDAWPRLRHGFVLPYFNEEDGRRVLVTDLHDGVATLRPEGEPTWRLPGFRATRAAVRASPPDVLILTTEMLHRWLMSPVQNAFFGLPSVPGQTPRFCVPRAIVFDEIHLYDTTHGAQVGLLLRRLQHRLRQAMAGREEEWQQPVMIGMSATIGDPAGFWRQLCGTPSVSPLVPGDGDEGRSEGRDYFLFVRPETYSRGRRVGDASTAIQTIACVAHNMVRRGPSEGEPPKFRSLVFQDSIGKVRKLAVEFRDAESRLFLPSYRLASPGPGWADSAAFHDGEYWHFDAADPWQYSAGRRPGQSPVRLTSSPLPVYSGSGRAASSIVQHDVIFATTSLEVGYDDPSIQFVLQHHAPRNPASFVQRRGRAGRSPADRPITAVTLSRLSYKDAFYYQNPRLLYDPSDYVPPLNVENYFVQRFQTLCLLFDELARLTGEDLVSTQDGRSLEQHLGLVEERLDRPEIACVVQSAFEGVTADSFRAVHDNWREAWAWFRQRMASADASSASGNTLLECCPSLPRNLFGTINLPTVRVSYPIPQQGGETQWQLDELDAALAFTEVAPGKVSRRFGPPWRHLLHWREPLARVAGESWARRNWVALEHYRDQGDGRMGPFNPDALRPQAELWGPDYLDRLPLELLRTYAGAVPDRFYRVRFYRLHSFGTLDPDAPKQPQQDWLWVGVREPDGGASLRYDRDGSFRKEQPRARLVSAESNSSPLSCSVVFPRVEAGRPSAPSANAALPALFPGLADRVEVFADQNGGARSVLSVYELHYAADATIRLLGKGNDPHAGSTFNRVRFLSEHDGRPVLYGHDLTTEGLRLRYSPAVLDDLAGRLFARTRLDNGARTHVQDQLLRYLLKSTPWPAGAAVNAWDARLLGDLIATARAESRAAQPLDEFLTALTSPEDFEQIVQSLRYTYWRERRLWADVDFVERLRATLTSPSARGHLADVFARVQKADEIKTYLGDVILLSLEHALRNLFLVAGSTRDEEVGSHGMLTLTYGRRSPESALYVYERNQDGNGATRLVRQALASGSPQCLLQRWYESALGCPVGDEEAFVKHVLRNHADELLAFRSAYVKAPIGARPSPRPLLQGLTADWLLADEDSPQLGRLAGILTGELSFAGATVAQLPLQLELLRLEDDLARRFGRSPLPAELAGLAATFAEQAPASVPALRALYDVYQAHAVSLGSDEDGPADPLDRFLTQVEHVSLSACVDACPACLAGNGTHGPMEATRHLVSRRILGLAHRLLTESITRPPEYGVEALAEVASTGGLILEHAAHLPPQLVMELRHRGLEQTGRFVEYRPSGAMVRTFWHVS